MKPYIPRFTPPKAEPKQTFRLGLASVSFRKNTQRAILEAMKMSGLEYIEWGSDVHAPHKSTNMLYDLAEMQRQYGIICSSYATYFRLGENLPGDISDYIKAAKILGTRTLRIWGGRKGGGSLSLSEIDKFMDGAWRVTEIAEKEDVKLCLECHENTFTERADDTLLLMDSVSSDNFGICWKPLSALSPKENLEYLKKTEQYVENIHVFHQCLNTRTSLAEGLDIWKQYIAALKTPRTLLLEFMPDDLITSLPKEADALKNITM